jgi:hypothetical protein
MQAISYAAYTMEKMVHIFHNYEGAEDSKFFGDHAVVDFNTKSMIKDTTFT